MLTLGRSRSPMLVLVGMVGAAMLLVLLAVGGAQEAGLLGAGGTAPLARAGVPRPSAARQSVAGMSSRFSSTYRLADGTLSTHVSPTPVNFRDTRGRWRAIDSRLVARGDAFANRAGAHAVSLPRRLSRGIHVSAGRERLSMRLVGADGTVAVRGAQARYPDVLPGVSAIYDSEATELRERLVLADRTAPARFVFALRASRGLQPRQQANGDVVFSRAGQTVFVLPAPFAFAQGNQDETHPVSSVLRRQHGAWTLSVAADRGWVHDALGRGPVVIDPTVEIDPDSQDCFIESDTPATNYCSDTHLSVGYDGVNDQRGLVQFDLSVLPKDAVILNADFGLTLGGHSTTNTKQVGVYRMLKPWTNSATWNKYDATHSWATAGAAGSTDASTTPAAVVTTGTGSGFVDWYPTRLVQDWVAGAVPNYGLLIRDVDPNTTANELDFHQRDGGSVTPELDIVWAPRTGQPDSYTFESQGVTGGSSLGVNVANGNLLLSSNDLHVPGTGLDLDLTRFHNSMGNVFGDQGMGIPGTMSLGRDVHLTAFADGTVAYYRGDGVVMPFLDRSVSGSTASFAAPYEIDASLTQNTSTHVYTLTFNATGLVQNFNGAGQLTSVKDQDAHTIALSYYSSDGQGLSQITDTQGRIFPVGQVPGDGFISSITEPTSHTWSYTYGHNDADYLTDAEDPAGGHTTYGYDSSDRLNRITTAAGDVTKVTYNGTTQQVASIIKTTDSAHTTGPTTTFTYSSPTTPCQSTNFDYTKTVVHRPDNSTTTYCANDHAQITYDTDNPTAATPSDDWYDLHDQYTQGTGTHSITIAGADAGSGVKKLSLERGNGTEVASNTLPCDPRNALNPTACPHTATRSITFNPSAIPEGAQIFYARTTDHAGTTTTSAPWTVRIDRTGPGLVSSIDAVRDSDGGTTAVSWPTPADPQLPDGTAGSGAVSYNYRYKVGTGSYGAPTVAQGPAFVVSGLSAGDMVTVEVAAVDAVGNVGATATVTDTVVAGDFSLDAAGTVVDDDGPDADYSREDEPIDPEDSEAQANTLAARDDYSENNCGSAPTCGTYDGLAAASYALRWYAHRNPKYPSFGNDCTNFISQAMKAGGMQFMRTEGVDNPTAGAQAQIDHFHRGPGSWWSNRLPNSANGYFFLWSHSWSLSYTSRDRLLEYHIGQALSSTAHLRPGDIVYYQFPQGNYPDFEPAHGAWTHASIVTRVTKNGPRFAQHTTDYEKSWANIKRDLTARFHSGPNQGVWKVTAVRPLKTAYNIG